MATSLVSTGVQFPDSTIQTTAATASAPSAVIFISSTVVSSAVASVAFTGLSNSTYAYYILEFSNVFSPSDYTPLYLYLSANNGSSYYGSSEYRFMAVSAGSGLSQSFGAPSNELFLAGNAQGVGTTTGNSASGLIQIFNASAAGARLNYFTGSTNNSNSTSYYTGTGSLNDSTATFNAFKIQFASGNISGGRFYLYGVKNS